MDPMNSAGSGGNFFKRRGRLGSGKGFPDAAGERGGEPGLADTAKKLAARSKVYVHRFEKLATHS